MATSLYSQVHLWCLKKYKDYVVFTKSIFCILGLILSYKLVEKTFLNILITILNNAWDDYDLRRDVIVVNFQEGTTAVLVPFFAYAADVHTGRFTMLATSCAVCIIGLVLNCLQSTEYNGRLDVRLFYPSLVLMTLAQAAQTVTLQPFLEDQLRRMDPTCDGDGDTAWGRRSRFWWNLVSFVAAIFAVFGPLARLQFRNLAIALTSLMGFCFLVFLLGTEYYVFVDTIENPFKDVVTVVLGAIGKTKLEYPQTPQELFGNSSTGDLHIAPIVPWLRWLDKAAIVQEQENRRGRAGIPSSVEEVRGVKLLLKMLPLWFTFLTLSLVAASGSTLFLVEAISLSRDSLTPILLFSSLQRFVEFVVSGASSYIIGKLGKRNAYNEQKMELVRIAIGLSFCVACCIAAWIAADERMQHESEDRLMSVYLLTPQYVLLGVMRGLCGQGLQSFYKSQVSETLCRFGPPFGEFMMGVGKFACMLCILVFSPVGWFQKELYNSYLDRYYILLAFLSYANVVVYMLVTRWYGDDVFLVGDDVQMGTADQADAQLLMDGLASRSTDRSHYRRVVSAPERTGSSGDTMAERPERPLLTTNNSWRSRAPTH